MSPSVGNFVHDLVEMAKAMEELPLVQAELSRAQAENSDLRDAIQRLELRLMDYRNEVEGLYIKVREAEVSRDDAELRFLEADDVANRVHRKVADVEAVLRSMAADLEGLMPNAADAPEVYEILPTDWGQSQAGQSASPPPAEPQPVPTSDGPSVAPSAPAPAEAATTTGTGDGVVEQDQSAPGPIVNSPFGNLSQSATSQDVEKSEGAAPKTIVEQGQSVDPLPTSGVSRIDSGSGSDAGPIQASADATHTSPSPGPYVGRLYIRTPGWISRADWLAGGGTDETYDWREGAPLPEGVAA